MYIDYPNESSVEKDEKALYKRKKSNIFRPLQDHCLALFSLQNFEWRTSLHLDGDLNQKCCNLHILSQNVSLIIGSSFYHYVNLPCLLSLHHLFYPEGLHVQYLFQGFLEFNGTFHILISFTFPFFIILNIGPLIFNFWKKMVCAKPPPAENLTSVFSWADAVTHVQQKFLDRSVRSVIVRKYEIMLNLYFILRG